ncbi:NUDIX hydrolase [Candidatus Falkowbacteria bacterium]|nr:NUDIX hydrolase [Candidatus Falkowbacteria bacterium]
MPKIIIVSGPVIIEDNKVLLDRHGKDNFWKFPGGQVENSETGLIETTKIKVKEELSIDIEIQNPTPIITHAKKDDATDVILVHFTAKRIGEIKPGENIREWKWHPTDNLPNDCAPNIKPIIQQIMK